MFAVYRYIGENIDVDVNVDNIGSSLFKYIIFITRLKN